MNNTDKKYKDYLRYILENGVEKEDRTGTGTISIFDYTIKFDMSEGFPLLTSKKVFTNSVIHELIWFLKGETNIKYLINNKTNIWNGDAYKNYEKNVNLSEDKWCKIIDGKPELYTQKEFIQMIKTDEEFSEKWGDLGPVYGKQWRRWGKFKYVVDSLLSSGFKSTEVDQIQNIIHLLKNNPDSRRIILSSWNVSDIDDMVLPPCHFGLQCYTYIMDSEERKIEYCKSLKKDLSYCEKLTDKFLDEKGFAKRKLSLKWFQRSVDSFLGLPFNIASYGILLHLFAKEVNMIPDQLIFNGGDCHIYKNHIEQVKRQLGNETFNLPKLVLKNKSFDSLDFDDIEIEDYEYAEIIKAPLSN
jgi:thymidylate synthase